MQKEDLALFLGMLCGDGHLSIHNKKRGLNNYYDYYTGFCNTDKRIIEIFADLFYKIFKVKGNFYPRDRPNRKRIYEFHSYSREVFDKINSLGFPVGVKRDRLRIPEIIKNGSEEEKFNFLSGFFITDGSLKRGNTIFFHSGSKTFLEELSILIYELIGVKREIKSYLQKEKYLSYQLNLNKEESRKILSMPLSHNGSAPVLSSEKFNFWIYRNNM